MGSAAGAALNAFVRILSPAGCTETGDGQGVIEHGKPSLQFTGEVDAVKIVTGEIDDLVAGDAYQVVMTPGIGIEPGRGAGVADLAGYAELDQRFQDAVDRGPGDAGVPHGNRLEDLVCRGMVAPAGKIFQNGPPLEGQGETILAAATLEFGNLGAFRVLSDCHGLQQYCI
jgi:hypothetical protein